MACLETVDILKRNNARVLLEILLSRETVTLGKTSIGEVIRTVNAICIGDRNYILFDWNLDCIEVHLTQHCKTVKGKPPEILLSNGEWTRITTVFKDHRFVPKNTIKGAPTDKDKLFQQRQEISLVAALNASGGYNVPEAGFITRARQAPDLGPHGKENLVDVVIVNMYSHTYNVSCKQTKAADLGGGGMAGLQKTVPGLVKTLYETTITDLKGLGFNHGESYNVTVIPQLQYKIPPQCTYTIFRGAEEVGGTIDFMYVGPAEVALTENKLNGLFIPIREYARKKVYYFRLRKRDVFANMVTINYEKLNLNGLPVLFTSGPMNSPASRFVIEDRVLSTSIVKDLHHECTFGE